jgi:hypothetical protein
VQQGGRDGGKKGEVELRQAVTGILFLRPSARRPSLLPSLSPSLRLERFELFMANSKWNTVCVQGLIGESSPPGPNSNIQHLQSTKREA